MSCDSRQLTQAQLEAGFQNQRTGVTQAIRPFSGQATPESLADYLNREVFPVLKQARAKLNEVFLQVTDNAPSGNPLAFYFSTDTGAADPTVGRIRLDNATQNTATTIRVSQSNGRRVDVTPWLDVMAGGATSPLGVVTLLDTVNPGRFIRFDLDSMTDQGDYWDLTVTPVESSHANPFVDGEGVVISFIPGVSAAGSTVPVGSLSPVAAETFIGNFTAAPAAPTARAGSDIAGTGLAYAAGGTLSVDATLAEILANGNTTDANDIHVSTGQQLIFDVGGDALGDIQSLGVLNVRTASTVDMRAATGNFGLSASAGNFNMSGTNQLNFTASAASGFIRFTTNGTARLIIAGDGSWQLAGDDGTTGELLQSQGATSPPIWATAVTASYTDGSVTLPKIATQAAGTVLANVTAGAASPTAHALSTLAGSGLTYTNVTGVMNWDGLAVAENSISLGNFTAIDFDDATYITVTLTDLGGGAFNVLSEWNGFDLELNGASGSTGWRGLDLIDTSTIAWTASVPGGTFLGVALDVNLTATYAWTGVHSFTAASFTVDVTGDVSLSADDDLLVSAGGVNIGAGFTTTTAAAGHLCLNASTGMILHAGATQQTTATTADMRLQSDDDIFLSPAGNVHITGASGAGQGALRINEGALSSTVGGVVATGVYWVRNDTPCVPMFTDDSGTASQLVNVDYAASVSVAGLIEIADQAEQEAGTDTTLAVTSGRQQLHPSAAKFWLRSTVSAGVPGIDASYNVTSLTDTAAGRLTINIATDFSSANWCSVASTFGGTAAGAIGVCNINAKAAGTVEIGNRTTAPALADPAGWEAAGFGDQ